MAAAALPTIRTLTPGYVMLMRHRALNLRNASGKAGLECYDLLHHMLGPDQVLELVDAWVRMREVRVTVRERPSQRKGVAASRASARVGG